jgi:hypothetical protein
VTLYDLLTILQAGSAFGGSLAACQVYEARGAEKMVMIGLGIAVAAACVAIARSVGERVIEKHYRPTDGGRLSGSQTSALRLLYLGAAAWIPISGVLGYQVVAVAIRMMS